MEHAAPMPRTSEVLWDGVSSLPFVLKRKRNGAILVTKFKERRPSQTLDLRLGSELKLVGGFPVQQLTLTEVKKVMLLAPKPVSLVFLNHDDVVLDNMSFLSEERGSFENEFESDLATTSRSVDVLYPPLRESSDWSDMSRVSHSLPRSTRQRPAYSEADSSEYNPFDSHASSSLYGPPSSAASPLPTTTSTSTADDEQTGRRRRRSPSSQPRKVSRLKLALERMNELLNRPVRRSGLNVSAGKSIVV